MRGLAEELALLPVEGAADHERKAAGGIELELDLGAGDGEEEVAYQIACPPILIAKVGT